MFFNVCLQADLAFYFRKKKTVLKISTALTPHDCEYIFSADY